MKLLRRDALVSAAVWVYLGGVAGAWLATTWAGFTEFPFREIGALLWPLLIVALAAGIG